MLELPRLGRLQHTHTFYTCSLCTHGLPMQSLHMHSAHTVCTVYTQSLYTATAHIICTCSLCTYTVHILCTRLCTYSLHAACKPDWVWTGSEEQCEAMSDPRLELPFPLPSSLSPPLYCLSECATHTETCICQGNK